MSELTGRSWVLGEAVDTPGPTFSVKSRTDGTTLEGTFVCATSDVVERAVSGARAAFRSFAQLTPVRRAEFLRAIAAELEADKDAIIARAMAETALPEARLSGELGRTTGQLRFFAGIIEDGTWEDVRHDAADPERKPLPKPDIVSKLRPLGPVVVFGASNFPLAFSVAGGDTASALAAGCPVIVKGHPAHPGTSELAAQAIVRAATSTNMHAGVFAFIVDNESTMAGEALVNHPDIVAGGFTGSKKVGTHLWRLAQNRPIPIPFYAEMGSVNPVVIMPSAIAKDGFAASLAASATMGVGQFCTNPGFVLLVGDSADFQVQYAEAMTSVPACAMLTEGIGRAFVASAQRLQIRPNVRTLVAPTVEGAPAVLVTTAEAAIADPELREEAFGPLTMLVECSDVDDAIRVLGAMEGQLTSSVHGTPDELAADLLWALEHIAGRVIFNQFPTGVEVCQSMVHGGPFPATSDARTTSVGGRAIARWARPVAFQNCQELRQS